MRFIGKLVMTALVFGAVSAHAAGSLDFIDYHDYLPAEGLRKTYSVKYIPASPGSLSTIVDRVRVPVAGQMETVRTYFNPDGSRRTYTLRQKTAPSELQNLWWVNKYYAPDGTPTGSQKTTVVPPYSVFSSMQLAPADYTDSYFKTNPLGQWSSSSQIDFESDGVPDGMEMRAWTATGPETVTVPAGTFASCIIVKAQSLTNVTMSWYCPDLGLVKQITQITASPTPSTSTIIWQLQNSATTPAPEL